MAHAAVENVSMLQHTGEVIVERARKEKPGMHVLASEEGLAECALASMKTELSNLLIALELATLSPPR